MKNYREELLTAEINAATDHATTIEIDVMQSYTETDGEAKDRYPTAIQIINACGGEVEILIIANDEEQAEYVADQTLFEFIRIPTGTTYKYDTVLPRCKYLYIRKSTAVASTATANLYLEFINYI